MQTDLLMRVVDPELVHDARGDLHQRVSELAEFVAHLSRLASCSGDSGRISMSSPSNVVRPQRSSLDRLLMRSNSTG